MEIRDLFSETRGVTLISRVNGKTFTQLGGEPKPLQFRGVKNVLQLVNRDGEKEEAKRD